MLDTLRRIVQEVNGADTLQEALDLMVRQVREAMGTEVCSIYLLDDNEERYVLMASEGLNRNAVRRVSLGVTEGLVGQVAQREELINLEDAHQHPKFHYLSETGEDPFHAYMGVPVMHQGGVSGVIVVQQRAARRFDQSEEAFLVTISAQLSAVVAYARATGHLHLESGSNRKMPVFIKGLSGAQGAAIGTGVVLYPPADLSSVPDRDVDDVEAEIAILNDALVSTREEIRSLGRRAAELGPEEQALFDAYLSILDRHALAGEVVNQIRESRQWAQGVLRHVIDEHAKKIESLDDPYLRERAADVRDMGRRLLAHLQQADRKSRDFPKRTILLGDEITPAMLMEVPQKRIQGIATVQGAYNSHVAIVARAMGIPTVVGASGMQLKQMDGKKVIIDGYRGRLILRPTGELERQFRRIIRDERQMSAGLEKLRDLPAETQDGQRVRIRVNTGLMTDIDRSLERGAEGVGLYRTEIPFMVRNRFPSEDEQRRIYAAQLKAFAPRPVTMRTLDIGGDKALPYFPISDDNPFLGWRGIRVTLDHPEIFLVQVRAMLRASAGLNNLRIMLPMVTNVSEVEEAQRLIHRAFMEVCEDHDDIKMPPVGVMIEVPAAVYQAAALAERVDFFSVGTNDLTQYLLAVDRNNQKVSSLYNSCHPAVLHALVHVVQAAHEAGKPVAVCGEMAGNPALAVMLMAMGVDSLSMNASNLPRVKAAIRRISAAEAREVLEDVLEMDDARVINAYIRLKMGRAGLENLLPRRQDDD